MNESSLSELKIPPTSNGRRDGMEKIHEFGPPRYQSTSKATGYFHGRKWFGPANQKMGIEYYGIGRAN
jgi:hypothetical protein